MTTIAWDGRVLAADIRSTENTDIHIGRTVKIGRFGKALFGATGSSTYCHLFRTWAAKGFHGPPPKSEKDEGSASGFVLLNGFVHEWWPDGRFASMRVDIFADGSGQKLALGAMAAGASAPEAVLIAARFDPYTGDGMTVITL